MSKEAMKLALEALRQIDEAMPFPVAKLAQSALQDAMAEQPAQQEPAAWQNTAKHMEIVSAEDWENIDPMWHWMYRPLYRPLYPSPSQREPLLREIAALSANALDDYKTIQKLMAERQPLTDEQIESLWDNGMYVHCSGITALRAITRAIEAAHGITGEKK